jgi:hypothetical protein
MADCRIVNDSVLNAVETIRSIGTNYQTEGNTLVDGLTSAISEMEGAAKDALQKFIDGDVKTFVAEQLPGAIAGMADLLEGNRQNFVDVDQNIADSISGGSGS